MSDIGRKLSNKASFKSKIDYICGLKATSIPRKVIVVTKKWYDEFILWLNNKGEKKPSELSTKSLIGTNKVKVGLKRGVEYEILDSRIWSDLTRNFGTTQKIEAILIQNPKQGDEEILFQFLSVNIYLPKKRSNPEYIFYYSDPSWILGDVKKQVCQRYNYEPTNFQFTSHISTSQKSPIDEKLPIKTVINRFTDKIDLQQIGKLPPINDHSKNQSKISTIAKNKNSSVRSRQPSVPSFGRYPNPNEKKQIEQKSTISNPYSTNSVRPNRPVHPKPKLSASSINSKSSTPIETATSSSTNVEPLPTDKHSSLTPRSVETTTKPSTSLPSSATSTSSNSNSKYFRDIQTISSEHKIQHDTSLPFSTSSSTSFNSSSKCPKPVGLNNLGNTCFFNASVQCLARVMPLTNFILSSQFESQINPNNPKSSKGRIANSYRNFLQDMCKGSSTGSRDPSDLRRSIVSKFKRFANFGQHDSQELLCSLLDGLHEDMNQSSYAKGRENKDNVINMSNSDSWQVHLAKNVSPIVDIFHGCLYSSISCPECNNVEAVHDPFMFLSLDIPRRFSTVKLSDCLNSFSMRETLDAKNKWKCEKCGRMVCATKEMGVDKLAKILIIHLKRFSGEGYFASKIDTAVDYPDFIEASSFAKNDHGKFRLIGAVFHSGGLGGGHYTSAAIDPNSGDWYNFNDSFASKIDSSSAHKGSAYILFYQRE